MMDDAKFSRICRLALIIATGMTECSREEYAEWHASASESDLFNEHTSRTILAKTFVELMRRAKIKPRYRVRAT